MTEPFNRKEENNMEDTATQATGENPFALNENEGKIATLGETQQEPTVEYAEYKVESSKAYPYINKAGDVKFGVAITITTYNNDDIFSSDEQESAIVIYDAESKASIPEEIEFSKQNLNKKMKAIPDEIFEKLTSIKKTVTLTKAHKNIKNKQVPTLNDLMIDEMEMKVVLREFKKNADLSKDIISKINEASTDGLEGTLASYNFKKHLLITGDAGLYQSLLCA